MRHNNFARRNAELRVASISGQQNYLRRLMLSVKVISCADGTMRIKPRWRCGVPGVLTRIGSAAEIERLINAALKPNRANRKVGGGTRHG